MPLQPRTPLNNRQRQIVDRVREQGFAAVEVLAQDHAVTTQTIRRDIKTLCEAGLLRRYHGGARLPSSVENVAYTARQVMHLAEKQRIAAAVAEQVPDQASLFITLGTSTEEVAKALLHHDRLRVITNNLNVATVLSDNRSSEVIVAGGVVRRRDRGITGEPTLDFINQFKTDYAVIGISGIEADGTLLDFDYQEVRVQQAIIANTRHVFLAADHSKFGRNALVRLGNISQVHTLFTDAEPPSSIRRIMQEAGNRIIVADRASPPIATSA